MKVETGLISCLLIVGIVTAIGCDLTSPPSIGENRSIEPPPNVQSNSYSFMSLDEQFSHLATVIPGFGGLFVDEEEIVQVYMKDPASASKASFRAAFTDVLGDMRELSGPMNFREGKFDFTELYNWKLFIRSSIRLDGWTSLDIDERTNTIVIGIEDASAIGDIERFKDQLRAPEGMIRFEIFEGTAARVGGLESESVTHMRTYSLSDNGTRPIRGGHQITNTTPNPDLPCTMSFNAVEGEDNYGMITNSHCSPTWWSDDDSNQRLGDGGPSGVNLGSETVDYEGWGSGGPKNGLAETCPSGYTCRASDSAFYDYSEGDLDGDDIQFGRIARTASRSTSSGSTSITGSFSITAEASSHVSGTELNKIGYATGWTYGEIDETCKDFSAPSPYASTRQYLCQYTVDAGNDGGDSGSPVFKWPDQQYGNITMYGILWGAPLVNDVPSTTTYIYSPISQVMLESDIDDIIE